MIRVGNVRMELGDGQAELETAVCRWLKAAPKELVACVLRKKSVDARDKGDVHFVVTADVQLTDEDAALRRLKNGIVTKVAPAAPIVLPAPTFAQRPVVVGAGPAGLFAALTLARAGARPILIERGKRVEERALDVERMSAAGLLDPESNVQFGEGGAGAFSDGKLTTGIKSPYQQQVLETFVQHGAPEEILILAKPHIGTDLLRGVVASMRREIERLGGETRFETKLTGIRLTGSRLTGVTVKRAGGETEDLPTETLLLCIGHSARDTIQTLFRQGVDMVQKPFAMGVRIEHPQRMVDKSQYGAFAGDPALRAADYKLNVHTPDGRGTYTFCMCPGGVVIAAASQEGGVAVNGMSYHARDGVNANAALLVGVRPEDFGDDHPLAGFVLQRSIEEAAYRLGGGGFKAPAQRVEDFLNHRATKRFGEVTPSYRPGVTPCDLHDCLPDFITADLALGIRQMDRQLRGFALPDAVMTGVETRSSSPVRLPRGRDMMSSAVMGLYPVGEGAGYAGGIVSAAVDGIGAAISAIERSRE